MAADTNRFSVIGFTSLSQQVTNELRKSIIENKLKEHNLLRTTRRKVIKHGQSINLGRFRIEFIKTNHSISDAAALAIYTPAGIIVHTGDFKIDYTPVFGYAGFRRQRIVSHHR